MTTSGAEEGHKCAASSRDGIEVERSGIGLMLAHEANPIRVSVLVIKESFAEQSNQSW